MDDQGLLKAYLDTEITVALNSGNTLKISSSEAPVVPQQNLFALLSPESGHAFVITAFNPFSEILDDDVNLANLEKLAKELSALSLRAVPCRGCSPDGSWCEESLIVFATTGDGDRIRRETLSLAIQFGQNAIFELTNTQFYVLGAAWGGAKAVRGYDAVLVTN